MTMQDLKLYLLNAGTFTISMTEIDTVLKIGLLIISIGYTAQRWYYLRQENKSKK